MWCHKVGTADEAFKEQCFPWERGASVGADLTSFTFKVFYMRTNLYKTLKERNKIKKQDCLLLSICVGGWPNQPTAFKKIYVFVIIIPLLLLKVLYCTVDVTQYIAWTIYYHGETHYSRSLLIIVMSQKEEKKKLTSWSNKPAVIIWGLVCSASSFQSLF